MRARAIVCNVCTTVYLSGASSCTNVIDPSPFELTAIWRASSNITPSLPSPIGTVDTFAPVSELITTITLFPQTANRRLCARSIACPDGSSQPASSQRFFTVSARASNDTISCLSSMLTKIVPLPSLVMNSGLPPSAIVPTTAGRVTSIAVALDEPPLNVNTRFESASKKIASGLLAGTCTFISGSSERVSNTVTDESRPLLV